MVAIPWRLRCSAATSLALSLRLAAVINLGRGGFRGAASRAVTPPEANPAPSNSRFLTSKTLGGVFKD